MEEPGLARVRAALAEAGEAAEIVGFPQGTATAADAAAAVGCDVAQIAKSIVFRAPEGPVLVVTSGANRVSKHKVAALLGTTLRSAGPEWLLETTGFPAGGVAPVGHHTPPRVLVDADLAALDPVWAAAGTRSHVFRTSAAKLVALTGGEIADIREE